MTRVAYVCADPGVPVFGRKGASVHVREVLRALARRGAIVDLHATRRGGEPPADLAGVRVVDLPSPGRGDPAVRERRAKTANADLRAGLDAAGPVDVVYERYSLWSTAAMTWAAERGVPSVLEVNAPLPEEQARHRVLVDRAGADASARLALATAGAVVAVSAPVADWVRRTAPGARVTVVPNGVDVHRFAVDRSVPRRDGTFTVAFVGTLKPWHGVEHLVAAVARLAAAEPDVRLLLIGDGPQRPVLAEAVAAAGLDAVTTWTGAVDPDDVPGLLAAADVAVAPYPPTADRYFSPLKVLEYLAAGVPVVASRVGQVPELLADGAAGVLVEPGDVAALSGALAALRAAPARRAALGAAGRAAAAERSWDTVVDRALGAARAGERRAA